MILSSQELKQLYRGFLSQFGHPDPLGYIARALLESEGNPAYYGVDGKAGFLPVLPQRAAEMTGSSDVSTLQGNVTATITMDLMFMEQYRNVEDMIVAFHFGEEAVSPGEEDYTGRAKSFLASVALLRPEVASIVDPPRATVNDVMKAIRDSLDGSVKTSKITKDVVNKILEER